MITQFNPLLTTVLFSHITHSFSKGFLLYFQNVEISVISDYRIKIRYVPQVLRGSLWYMSAHGGWLISQCLPRQIQCPLRALCGRRSQGLPGLVDTRAVSSLLSTGLLWERGKRCRCPLSEFQASKLGIGHILGTLRCSSLERREWEGRRLLGIEEPWDLWRTGFTWLSTSLSPPACMFFLPKNSLDSV
jgi:hypothetical protein